jgi:hypothetical protein
VSGWVVHRFALAGGDGAQEAAQGAEQRIAAAVELLGVCLAGGAALQVQGDGAGLRFAQVAQQKRLELLFAKAIRLRHLLSPSRQPAARVNTASRNIYRDSCGALP